MAKRLSLFLLLTLLSPLHTHARDSQFFNKMPNVAATAAAADTTKMVVPETKQPLNSQQQEPNFMPENENNYGLYAHDSAKLHPSATSSTTTVAQPLANKNYNPVAYVGEPEDINETATFMEEEGSKYGNSINGRNNNNYFNGGSSFNSRPQGMSDTTFNGGATFRPQGMSDTRFLENGKYFYDVKREKYNNYHPYKRLRANPERNVYNNKNMYENSENAYEFNSENSMGGYQNQEEFQDEP